MICTPVSYNLAYKMGHHLLISPDIPILDDYKYTYYFLFFITSLVLLYTNYVNTTLRDKYPRIYLFICAI